MDRGRGGVRSISKRLEILRTRNMTIQRLRLQSHLVQILGNAFLQGLYFCAEIPGPFFPWEWDGWLPLKELPPPTRTHGRTAGLSVCRGAGASVCAAALCVPSALFLFLVCLCEEEEQERRAPPTEKRKRSSKLNEAFLSSLVLCFGKIWLA